MAMKKITEYSIFEGEKSEEYVIYFNDVLNNTPEGKDFKKWFDIKPVRTGRFYITKKRQIVGNEGFEIPSKSYFDPNTYPVDKKAWYYEFASSNGSYGTTRGELKDLFRDFIITAIKKSRPSSIPKKALEEFFSKESNFPVGNLPSATAVYNKILNESEFIQDFKFILDSDISRKCKKLGISIEYSQKQKGIVINLNPSFIVMSILGNKKYKSLLDIADKLVDGKIYLFIHFRPFGEDQYGSELNIIPKTTKGKNTQIGRSGKTVKIGIEDKKELEKIIEELLKSSISDNSFYLDNRWGSRKPHESLQKINEYLISNIFGNESIKKEEIEQYIENKIMDLVGSHMENNPLDTYLLDDFPSIKKEIMDKYSIPNISKLGKLFNTGWLGDK
jgi:hypothetical protein